MYPNTFQLHIKMKQNNWAEEKTNHFLQAFVKENETTIDS